MVQITNETTVGEASPFLTKEHIEELLESDKVTPMPYGKPVIEMTVGEFLGCLDDEYALRFFQDPEELLVVAVGRLKSFKKQMEDIQKVMSLNEIKLTQEEQQAQRGVVFPSFEENMLCDCVEYFHLATLDAAENIPLANYLVMKRKKSAEALYERNLNRIYSEKAKAKSKRK